MSMKGLQPDEGNIWVLSAKGLKNEFVRTMFSRYNMTKMVPGKWILAGYVEQMKEDTDGQEKER